ncbi:hypothetical protein ACXKR8_000660 [Streptacidiphilus sp. PAMC 29251]
MTVAQELRERAAAYVNNHMDLWVTADDDGTLVLAAQEPASLFQAAAEWLNQGPAYTVLDVRWHRQDTEPAHTLRISLTHPHHLDAANNAAAVI